MMYRGVPGTGTPLITDLDEPPATGPILGYSHQAIANLYTYAQNDPINRVDPSGLDSTVVTIEGTSYSISDTRHFSPTKEEINRFIVAKGIAEDAKAVFLALTLEAAVYEQALAAPLDVAKELQRKANEGALSTVDLDYVKKYGSRSLTNQEIAEWVTADQMLAQFYGALEETRDLFAKLGFDKLELEGWTSKGGFSGSVRTGMGIDAAIEIVTSPVPILLNEDRGIEREYPEADIAAFLIPIPGLGRVGSLLGRGVAGAVRFVVPRAIRAFATRMLEYAIAKGNQFVLKPVAETAAYLLERMGAAGVRGLEWLESRLSTTNATNSGLSQLVHLTDDAGEFGIAKIGTIIGSHGIFAIPSDVAAESTILKVLRTGLTPAKTMKAVPIPDNALALFSRPIPIGPYSGWKFFGGVRYAAAGSLNTASGALSKTSTLIGPKALIYGPDGVFYIGIATAGGIYIYGQTGGGQ